MLLLLVMGGLAVAEDALPQSPQRDYKLDVGDVLSITVLPAEEVSRPEAVVLPTGRVELMYVGAVRAKGMTLEQFRQLVTQELAKYVVNPKVTVTLKRYGFRKVFLTGAVARAGEYEFQDGLRLWGLFTLAGGPTDKANLRMVTIHRTRGESSQDLIVDAEQLRKEGKDFPLEAGDAIEVPRLEGEIRVFGEVKSPGTYPYERHLKLSQLIFKAGGFTDQAIRDRVRVIRGTTANVKEYDLSRIFEGDFSQDVVLENGDIVVVGKKGLGLWEIMFQVVIPLANFATTIITLLVLLGR